MRIESLRIWTEASCALRSCNKNTNVDIWKNGGMNCGWYELKSLSEESNDMKSRRMITLLFQKTWGSKIIWDQASLNAAVRVEPGRTWETFVLNRMSNMIDHEWALPTGQHDNQLATWSWMSNMVCIDDLFFLWLLDIGLNSCHNFLPREHPVLCNYFRLSIVKFQNVYRMIKFSSYVFKYVL